MAKDLKGFIESCLRKAGGSDLICTEVCDDSVGYHYLSGMHAFIFKDADGTATGFSMYHQPPLPMNELYLDSLPIPPSLTGIGGNFCRDLPSFRVSGFSVPEDGSLFTTADENRCLLSRDGKTLLAAVCGKNGTAHIPEGVEEIADSALRWCRVSNRLPSTLKRIGKEAFKSCLLEPEGTLILPEGVTDIGDCAFRNLFGAPEIRFPASLRNVGTGLLSDVTQDIRLSIAPGNESFRVENNCLIRNADDCLLTAGTRDRQILIPEGVKIIGHAAVCRLPYLSLVDIPAGVEKIVSAEREENDYLPNFVTCNDYEVGPDGAPIEPAGPQPVPEIRVRAGSCAEEYCRRYGLKYRTILK